MNFSESEKQTKSNKLGFLRSIRLRINIERSFIIVAKKTIDKHLKTFLKCWVIFWTKNKRFSLFARYGLNKNEEKYYHSY